MTQVQLLERQIQKLNASALAAFRKWFQKYDAIRWDHQIRADASAGRLDKLAKQALAEHRSGKTKRL